LAGLLSGFSDGKRRTVTKGGFADLWVRIHPFFRAPFWIVGGKEKNDIVVEEEEEEEIADVCGRVSRPNFLELCMLEL